MTKRNREEDTEEELRSALLNHPQTAPIFLDLCAHRNTLQIKRYRREPRSGKREIIDPLVCCTACGLIRFMTPWNQTTNVRGL